MINQTLFLPVLLAVLLIATGLAWFLSRHKSLDKPVRVMLFVGYFWLAAFVQLLLVAVLHSVARFF